MKKMLSIILLVIMALTACESRPEPVYSSEHLGITIDYILDAGIDGLNSHREIGDNQVAFTPEERDYSKEINFVYNIDSRYIEEIQMSMSSWEDIDEYMSIIFELLEFGEYDISDNGERLRNACSSSLDAYDSQELMGGVYYYVTVLEGAGANGDDILYIKMNRHRFENEIMNDIASETEDTPEIGTVDCVEWMMDGQKINGPIEENGYYVTYYEIDSENELYTISDTKEYISAAWIYSSEDKIPYDYIQMLGASLGVLTLDIEEQMEYINSGNDYVYDSYDGWRTIVTENTDGRWMIMFNDGRCIENE